MVVFVGAVGSTARVISRHQQLDLPVVVAAQNLDGDPVRPSVAHKFFDLCFPAEVAALVPVLGQEIEAFKIAEASASTSAELTAGQ